MAHVSEPLISMVMPSFNQAAFLKQAALSVLEQPNVDVELIVCDPGSTDGSRDLLSQMELIYPGRLLLCFEPDKGQSDAVNKGLAKARGRILGWLNSDDRLRPGALECVVRALNQPGPRWAYGRAGVIDADDKPMSSFITAYKNFRGRRFSHFKLLQENFICQMSVFWTKDLWDMAGGVDLDKHLDMDYDLWLRFAAVCDPLVLKDTLADFRVHAAAKGSVQTDAQLHAALETATSHASRTGLKGKSALLIHRALSLRTKLAYRCLKPRSP